MSAKDETTVEELTRETLPKETQKEIASLREALNRLQEVRHYIVPVREKGNTIRFAVVSDLHAGSLYERFDALAAFYDTLKQERVKTVLIAGDLLDGHGMYRGQEFEQYAHGYTKQVAALCDRHPFPKNLSVSFITGNHDYSFHKLIGMDVGEAIAEKTKWNYVGRDQGWVDLKTKEGQKLSVGLFHPDGGTAYAISYKSQKLVEKIPGGRKPDIVFIGHYHKSEWLPAYRNVEVFQAGCFQSQTAYMARKPTDAHVGGWIVDVVIGERKHLTGRVKAEFIPFYEPSEKR
jgi:UDP-2,3-diacylglucosamine pyrophosphatase LpxH